MKQANNEQCYAFREREGKQQNTEMRLFIYA